FLEESLQKRPDYYLHELAEDLRKVCGVAASEASVWRALRRIGYSCKQVELDLYHDLRTNLFIFFLHDRYLRWLLNVMKPVEMLFFWRSGNLIPVSLCL
ncbi:hypothetical protein M407DRAFT_79733, partial [Tulasnella calospora MUT 4182]